MPHFSEKSKERIATLHPDLQRVVERAIRIMDFSVLDGLRGKERQDKAVADRRSKVVYPNSKHNRSQCEDGTYIVTMSDAVDIAPYPIKWPNLKKQTTKEYLKRIGAFYMLAGVILASAYLENVKLRWGGNFKSMFDGPHFERVVE